MRKMHGQTTLKLKEIKQIFERKTLPPTWEYGYVN